jgi:hypothetical protein
MGSSIGIVGAGVSGTPERTQAYLALRSQDRESAAVV